MALRMDKTYVTEQFNIMCSVFDDMEIETRAVHEAAAHCVWNTGYCLMTSCGTFLRPRTLRTTGMVICPNADSVM
jgi:hypothetical protein